MNQKKHKYFSQLTPKQKDKASGLFLRMKLNILNLPTDLANGIIQGLELDCIFKIKSLIEGNKMFYYDKLDCYIPLNIGKLLKVEVTD